MGGSLDEKTKETYGELMSLISELNSEITLDDSELTDQLIRLNYIVTEGKCYDMASSDEKGSPLPVELDYVAGKVAENYTLPLAAEPAVEMAAETRDEEDPEGIEEVIIDALDTEGLNGSAQPVEPLRMWQYRMPGSAVWQTVEDESQIPEGHVQKNPIEVTREYEGKKAPRRARKPSAVAEDDIDGEKEEYDDDVRIELDDIPPRGKAHGDTMPVDYQLVEEAEDEEGKVLVEVLGEPQEERVEGERAFREEERDAAYDVWEENKMTEEPERKKSRLGYVTLALLLGGAVGFLGGRYYQSRKQVTPVRVTPINVYEQTVKVGDEDMKIGELVALFEVTDSSNDALTQKLDSANAKLTSVTGERDGLTDKLREAAARYKDAENRVRELAGELEAEKKPPRGLTVARKRVSDYGPIKSNVGSLHGLCKVVNSYLNRTGGEAIVRDAGELFDKMTAGTKARKIDRRVKTRFARNVGVIYRMSAVPGSLSPAKGGELRVRYRPEDCTLYKKPASQKGAVEIR